MVRNIILFLVVIFYLLACSQSAQLEYEVKDKEPNMFEEKMTDDEKDVADNDFFQSIEKMKISEEGFLLIAKYLIESAKESDFKEVDPILGKKEKMYSKDFKDPYVSYHYVQIPHNPEVEVYLKYRKDNNKLTYLSLKSSGSAGAFKLGSYDLNVLDVLNLKVVEKVLPDDSNKLFKYSLTDSNFEYEVYGTDNIDNKPPKEFYIFRVYIN